MLLDLLGKKSMSLYTAIFMNDLAIEIKNLGLGIRLQRFFGYSETKRFSSILEARKVNRVFENN